MKSHVVNAGAQPSGNGPRHLRSVLKYTGAGQKIITTSLTQAAAEAKLGSHPSTLLLLPSQGMIKNNYYSL
jgi:hypothetical protein